MEGALAWIGQIVNWIARFIPRWEIIDTTMGGVKFVRGWKPVTIGPGIHWWWPLVTRLQLYPTARQADALPAQTLVTTDDKTIIVGGMIVYEVRDIEKLIAHTYDPQNTIRDLALSAIHDVCARLSWETLKEGQRDGTLDRRLRAETKKALQPYGVKVLKTMLTDLAPARVLKLIQSTAKEGEA